MSRAVPPSAHAERRARALEAVGPRAAMVIAAAPELRVGRDLELRYRPAPELYYLTGCTEPEAVLVLAPEAEQPFTLFVRPRDAERERWSGRRLGVEGAAERFGADATWSVVELDARLRSLVAGADTLYARLESGRPDVDDILRDVLRRARLSRQRTGTGPEALVDPGAVLDEMRLVKDAHELELIREAARISAASFREAAAVIRPGAGEYEVEAALEAAFRGRGADGFAFQTIVASGENAAYLHYVDNDRAMQAGELLLVDGGAAYGLYAADLSRTFPVSGGFTPDQRALYETVLAARDAAIATIRPGATLEEAHHAALEVLVGGMIDAGLLEGTVDQAIEEAQALRAWYPHRTSHWLGLEVHDVGGYSRDGAPVPLRPGMVLTIEPGLYIPADAEAAPAHLRGTGIRIEDDLAVTLTGAELLSAALPADPESLEAMIGGAD